MSDIPLPNPARRLEALPGWGRMALAAVAGAAMALGQAPYDLWYLALAALVAVCLLFESAPRPRAAMATGWAFGTGYFGLGLTWIVEPFQVDAAETGWMAPFALFGMAAGLALFWALAFWIAGRAPRARLLALVAAWSAAELARAYVFTGFPWALVAYLWEETPAAQWASVLGPHGLTLATLAAVALVAAGLCPRGPRLALVAGALLLGTLLAGGMALTPPLQDLAGRPVVRLVQPNAPQREKWQRDRVPVFFRRQVEFTGAAPQEGIESPPVLVVWPETALPMLLEQADEAFDIITDAAGPAQVALGIQRRDGNDWYNSLALVEEGPVVEQVYDKHHLVPFGEYMPFKALFRHIGVGGLAARADGGYSSGPGPALLDLGPQLGRALPLICYEAVFPQDVSAAPERPEFLLQITNDAWFGSFSGPYQHLAQARMRAIEQGLPLLRAANTGVSAVIDGAGRILRALPLGQAGYLDSPLPPPLRVTVYSRTGDYSALLAIIVLALLAFRQARRRVSH